MCYDDAMETHLFRELAIGRISLSFLCFQGRVITEGVFVKRTRWREGEGENVCTRG